MCIDLETELDRESMEMSSVAEVGDPLSHYIPDYGYEISHLISQISYFVVWFTQCRIVARTEQVNLLFNLGNIQKCGIFSFSLTVQSLCNKKCVVFILGF